MTKLLVSVRDVAEARIALEAGVDLIDLKEPSRGALGAVDLETAQAVVAVRDEYARLAGVVSEADKVPLSMALGELVDYFADDVRPSESLTLQDVDAPNIAAGIRFVKIGLAGCAARNHWREQLRWLVKSVVRARAFVAVVYADAHAVEAPEMDDVLIMADELGARGVLVDTAIKDGRTVLDHWSVEQMELFTRRQKIITVIGGGLNLTTIRTAAAYNPYYIAVRGAACVGTRESTIDGERIRSIRDLLPRPVLRRAT